MKYTPDPKYLSLCTEDGALTGGGFADPVSPASFPEHILRFRNDRWAKKVGLDDLSDAAWVDHFARFEPLPNNFPRPLAQRYHGHQFRHYNPQLGDGRGFSFAQLRSDDGLLRELGTKGSGRTPYSRGGDGRLTLKGGVREILATEFLEALHVDTSKTFSIVETGEALQRNDEPSPTRSCVMVRLSKGHVRIGAFQRHAHEGNRDRLARLVAYSCEAFYPDLDPNGALGFLRRVGERMAQTGAAWLAAGFVHGVLNTDNINITGESFDYGPWRFLPRFDPNFTAAYFDHNGLYAYGRQMEALRFNLGQLAISLKPLIGDLDLEDEIRRFDSVAEEAVPAAFCRRLGLQAEDPEAFTKTLWGFLGARPGLPFAQAFHDLRGGAASLARAHEGPYAAFYGDAARALFDATEMLPGATRHALWQRPYAIDMRIEEVEELWARIAHHDDWQPLNGKVADLRLLGEALG